MSTMIKNVFALTPEGTYEEVCLKEHVENAQLLLAYAAEEGLQVDQEIVKEIINARYYLQKNDFDQEKEAQFWTAFNTLSQIIHPVCIESIRATRVRQKTFWRFKPLELLLPKNKSEAAQTVHVYQRWTMFTLILLLVVQIYWLVGSVIITQVTNTQSFQEEINQLTALKETAKELGSSELGTLVGEIREKYQDKANDIHNNKKIYYEALHDWRSNIFTKWMFDQYSEEIPQGDDKEFAKIGYIEAQQAAQLILQPIQQYILPLLYGWIGALAYVLRCINKEIKEITYTRQSNEHYRLRIQLGALSGLAVGWFLSVDPEHYTAQPSFSFGNLSPLALSFLAGYSVELLFSAMDKIVSAFSSTD
ncbi:MAG: hypothetical protein SD837_11810 [Candidatus Electrothrix scaldis]|nr:MAG: hypothetical protein SD837_11810 [Candidatus Electrothrix sp. GW3-3]